MTRSQRLRPVANIKQKEQLNSARELSKTIEEVKKQEQRLAELAHYRDDYRSKFQQMTNTGASIERIRHYQEFIARLNQSIVLQTQRIVDGKKQLEIKKLDWKHARARSDAFDKVVDRYRDEENQLAEQRQQKEADDQAQRKNNTSIRSRG
ncbi:MAG: flagellar export protein FliJ [Gammaproteobacteria bacterium]|nr:MAG: flagellar export protein FliJ [Gammaproteobacteria bacterium]